MDSSRFGGVAALLLAASLAGCSEPVEEAPSFSQELSDLLNDPARVVAGRDTSHADGLLAHVRYARLLGDRAGVVAADEAPPFLRVFEMLPDA